MTAPLRLIFAAALVTVSAVGGAAYAGRAADPSSVSDRPVSAFNFTQIIGNPDPDKRILETAYEQLIHSYYEPVDAQRLADGESKALNAFVHRKDPKAAAFGTPRTTGVPSHDLPMLEAAVDQASQQYASLGTKAQFTDVAVSGMLAGLGDPYTTYLTAADIQKLDEMLQGGDFGGIGVYIGKDPKTGAVVVDPIEGNPAIKAGVRTGDAILAVDNEPTAGKPLDDIERMIRGPRGTVVALRVRHHDNAVVTIHVTRDLVHVPSVLAKIEDGYSYVRLGDFGKTSAEEVRAAFLAARAKGVKGYILDVRNNGGGYLDAAVDVSSIVIPSGAIVSTIDRAGNKNVRNAAGNAISPMPLVVLVNKYTASSSEITAGALQDYHAATLVGTKTFGKGVVQSVYTIPDRGGALKITTARYVTPNGRDIQHKGIVPDVVIDQRVDAPIIDTPADKQLAAAKAILKKEQQ